MRYIENPKTKGSGIICAIPQTGICPNKCDDCFFQSGRSYLEPLDESLPNMPSPRQAEGRVVRINDGNDSNIDYKDWAILTDVYGMKFYNTAIPAIDHFDAPVVLTVNPGELTNHHAWLIDSIPPNLMFIRVRTNTWNIPIINSVVEHYSAHAVPIVLTFMAYYAEGSIQCGHEKYYTFRKRTLNSYYAITTAGWEMVIAPYKYNKWVYSCGKVEGELGDSHCRFCGNCLREYFAAMERMRNSEA